MTLLVKYIMSHHHIFWAS